MGLVLRSGLDLTRVYELLARHTDYFVRVGGTSRYTLNRFAKCKGAIVCIQEDISTELAAAEKRQKLLRFALIIFFIFFVLSR